MARVRTALDIPATPEAVWDLVTDWPAHSRWIPLTVVTVDGDSPVSSGLGTKFTGRSGLGPVAFDDPMTVTEWQPPVAEVPGVCRLQKAGPWVTGWAEIRVSANPSGATLEWIEEVRTRWTPRFTDPVVSKVGSAMFGGTLRKLARELATR